MLRKALAHTQGVSTYYATVTAFTAKLDHERKLALMGYLAIVAACLIDAWVAHS